MVIRKLLSLLLIAAITSSQSGCSAFAGSRQPFSVSVSESDAQVFINGELKGSGHIETIVPRNKSVSIMVKKEGYQSVTREVGTTLSSVGTLDVIAGSVILLPLFGLLFPGSRRLEQDNISVVIRKEG